MVATKSIVCLLLAVHRAWAFPALGGYTPASDVNEHIQMGLDVKAFSDALRSSPPDYAKAKAIYTFGGGQSCKSVSTPRKLKDFATAVLEGESYYDLMLAGGMKAGFWDKWMTEALDGLGRFASLNDTRRSTVIRYAVDGLMMYYAAHELEQGISKGKDPATRNDVGSAHAWSEGWAFYAGDGVNGTGTPWSKTKEYDGDFANGLPVRTSIVPHFNKGLEALRSGSYDAAAALQARDTIYTMWALPSIRLHAEGYAHFVVVEGWLGAKAPTAATALRQALDIQQDRLSPGGFCGVLAQVHAALPSLGLDCSMLGTFQQAAARGVECSTACDAPSVTLPAGMSAVAAVDGMPAADVNCTAAAIAAAGSIADGTSQETSVAGARAGLWLAATAPLLLHMTH